MGRLLTVALAWVVAILGGFFAVAGGVLALGAVLFALLTLKEPEFAWNQAHSLALDSDQTWSELVKAYEKVDPIATLPIHQRLVENELVEAGAQHYRLAARRLAKMRKLSAGSYKSADVNDLIAELREIHRRRPLLRRLSASSSHPEHAELRPLRYRRVQAGRES